MEVPALKLRLKKCKKQVVDLIIKKLWHSSWSRNRRTLFKVRKGWVDNCGKFFFDWSAGLFDWFKVFVMCAKYSGDSQDLMSHFMWNPFNIESRSEDKILVEKFSSTKNISFSLFMHETALSSIAITSYCDKFNRDVSMLACSTDVAELFTSNSR